MNKPDDYQMMPVQPYLILGTENYETVPQNDSGISHFYEFTLESGQEKGMTAVPDGSVDLLFGIGESDVQTLIGGTVLAAKGWLLESGRKYFGVRFFPGGCILPEELTIGELVNNDLEIDGNLFGEELVSKLAEGGSLLERSSIFRKEYGKMKSRRFAENIVALEGYIRARIYGCQGNISIRQLAEETGYSECYIRRIFQQIHGISPKNFERFVRFQNVLHMMNDEKQELRFDELAQMCGYYDESHMMKDFKSFAGVTPQRYDHMIAGTKLRGMC